MNPMVRKMMYAGWDGCSYFTSVAISIVSHSVRRRMGVKKNYEKFDKKPQIGWKWTQKKQSPNDPI